MINGIDGIALTKLDVLDDFEEIPICTGYKVRLLATFADPALQPQYSNSQTVIACTFDDTTLTPVDADYCGVEPPGDLIVHLNGVHQLTAPAPSTHPTAALNPSARTTH